MSEVNVARQAQVPGRNVERSKADSVLIVALDRMRLGSDWIEPGTIIAHARPEGITAEQLDKALAGGQARVRRRPAEQ